MDASVTPPASDDAAPVLEAERDALRIQAAAVVAQQAVLGEEELRQQQRRAGLEQQEEQLAQHLEDKRRNLVEMREQLKAERETFREEKAAEEQKLAARRQEAEQAFAEADEERKQARKERARFLDLRKRLQERWDKRFAENEATLGRREQDLQTATEALEHDRAALAEQRLRHNGDMEVGRRRLEEEARDLASAQKDWETCLARQKVEYQKRTQDLAERETTLARAERELGAQKQAWEHGRDDREKESQGLETRVRNQRQKLQAVEQELARTVRDPLPDMKLPFSTTAIAGPATPEAPADLRALAEYLADQRQHLLEQWDGVARLHDHWQQERATILAELEATGQSLEEREQTIIEYEQMLAEQKAQLERKQQGLTQARCSLESRQARLASAALEWEAERARVLSSVRHREESATARVQQLETLGRRMLRRQRGAIEALERGQRRCEETRKQYAALWDDYRQQMEVMLREREGLAAETLAVERLRLELVGKSENAAAAEKRLDKFRRQSETLTERASRELAQERAALREENKRLEERSRRLHEDDETITAWRRKLVKRQQRFDQQTAELQASELIRAQELQRLLGQHQQDAQHIRELRDELERVVRQLMDDAGDVPASAPQAA